MAILSIKNQTIAKKFLNSLRIKKVKEFTKKHFLKSYSDAILLHHPQKDSLNKIHIQTSCINLIDTIINEFEKTQPSNILKHLKRISTNKNIWFDEFNLAYMHYKKEKKSPIMASFLLPFFQNAKSILDIGCGNGNFACYLASSLPLIRISGCDVLDWRTDKVKLEKPFEFFKIYKNDFLSSVKRHDLGILYQVIHHATKTKKEAIYFLKKIKNIKRLIVVEDVFFELKDYNKSLPWHSSLAKQLSKNKRFEKYCSLSKKNQKAFCIAMDTLSNCLTMKIFKMALPYGFHSIHEWHEIFNKSQWKISHTKILGFIPGLFHQPNTAMFICDKK